jgi:Protein of unknown function (DUF3572)
MRLKNHSHLETTGEIPLRFIRFLAADEERLSHMVALTGLGEEDFTTRAQDPQFQAFVMDYGLENETLLLEFAASEGLKPEWIVQARRKLPGATF